MPSSLPRVAVVVVVEKNLRSELILSAATLCLCNRNINQALESKMFS
uniref:Uncharacterized protein n=1 Tax=Moniliophthora roreri TaxID=221103 RepID=A0A0W0F4S6_MONRR